MKNAILLALCLPILFSITLKEPSVNGQVKLQPPAKIITTPDFEKSKVINAVADLKNEENVIAGIEVNKQVEKINSENIAYKKKNKNLSKGLEYYKQKFLKSQKTIEDLRDLAQKQKEENAISQDEPNDYLPADTTICKIDTIYLAEKDKRNLIQRIFNTHKK